MLDDARCAGLEGLALRDLAVEQAQRVSPQAQLTCAVQLRLERPVIRLERLEVGGAALAVPNRVELEPQLAESHLLQPALCHLDDLRIERSAPDSDRFDVELEELAVAAFLGAVVAEHRADQVETRRLRTLVQITLEVGPHDPGRGLGPQGKVPPPAVVESVELLGHGVGVLAYALAELGVLDRRSHDLLVAEAAGAI